VFRRSLLTPSSGYKCQPSGKGGLRLKEDRKDRVTNWTPVGPKGDQIREEGNGGNMQNVKKVWEVKK
jgi:hypothetical protein